MRAVTGLLEYTVLSACHHLDWPVAFQEPAHEIDVIGEHVEHRRRMRIALENCEGLRARIVDTRHAADDLAETAVPHLLLGAQEALLVAAAVADPQLALGCAQSVEDLVGVAQRKSDRLFDQHRLAELQGVQDGWRVLLLRCRDDDGGDSRMRDHLLVAAAVEIGTGRLGERAGAGGIAVGNRKETHCGMLGGKPRAQGADASRPDHGDADIVLLHPQPHRPAQAILVTPLAAPERRGHSDAPFPRRRRSPAPDDRRPPHVRARCARLAR